MKEQVKVICDPDGKVICYQIESEQVFCGGGCGKKDLEIDYYMIHDELWKKFGCGDEGQMCLSCLEKSMGREVHSSDFTPYPVNRTLMFFLKRLEAEQK